MADNRAMAAVAERTCAVGVLRTTPDEFIQDVHRPRQFEILGTGFLVDPRIVMTNRHVLEKVHRVIADEKLAPEKFCVSFLRPEGTTFRYDFRWVGAAFSLEDPPEQDIGLCRLLGPVDLAPVRIEEYFRMEVGDECAACGYPFGSELLRRPSDQGYRFGPVLQRGYVSAIAPYGNCDRIDRVLLDLRTADGMSGAPVFDPNTGEVFAVHDAGSGAVVAFGIPLSSRVVQPQLALVLSTPGGPAAQQSGKAAVRVEHVRRRPRGG
jgi:hypothetical protein